MIVTSAGGLAGAVFLFDHDRRVRDFDAVAAREGRAKKRLHVVDDGDDTLAAVDEIDVVGGGCKLRRGIDAADRRQEAVDPGLTTLTGVTAEWLCPTLSRPLMLSMTRSAVLLRV
jgi:hypothetical protein